MTMKRPMRRNALIGPWGEVKGGRVKRTDGMWTFTNRGGDVTTKSRGPFEQASEAIYSIMAEIKERADSIH